MPAPRYAKAPHTLLPYKDQLLGWVHCTRLLYNLLIAASIVEHTPMQGGLVEPANTYKQI
jgi:hypothetical protein